MTDAALDDPDALLAREAALRARAGSLRMRDAAAALGVPEAALLEVRRQGGEAIRLARPEAPEGFGRLLARLPEAGTVMALTRNETAVHEKVGRFNEPAIEGTLGQVVGAIDLRLFLQHWRFGYALTEGTLASLQFFDAAGTAVHKVYRRPETDPAAFDRIVADFADAAAAPAHFDPPAPRRPERPDAEVDVTGLREAWRALRRTDLFFGLMRQFGVTRAQAMRLAGPVHRVEPVGPWINVLDPTFNLHLREDRIERAWLVRKPSVNGDVHSLELFDAAGECFVQIFGQRLAGTTERTDWRALVGSLPAAD